MILKNAKNIFRYRVHRPIAIDRNQPPGTLIIISHRPRLFLIRLNAGLNHFEPVVIAGNQLGSVDVANFIDRRRLKVDVIDPPAGWTRTTSSNPEQQLIIIHVQPDHNRPSPRGALIVKELVVEQSIQPSGLSRSPRETIQNITAPTVRFRQPNPDHFTNQVVGNQLSAIHNSLNRATNFSSLRNILPKQVTGGNLRHLKALHNALGLGALTGPRRTKQYHGTQIA